jgi:hypothetical protein
MLRAIRRFLGVSPGLLSFTSIAADHQFSPSFLYGRIPLFTRQRLMTRKGSQVQVLHGPLVRECQSMLSLETGVPRNRSHPGCEPVRAHRCDPQGRVPRRKPVSAEWFVLPEFEQAEPRHRVGSTSGRSRSTASCRVACTHDPDRVPIGIRNDRVASTPERVIRSLLTLIARAGEPLVQLVNCRSLSDAKPNDRPARAGRPTLIPLTGECLTVKVHVEATGRTGIAMVLFPLRISVGDVEAELPIELNHCCHIANDYVDLIEGGLFHDRDILPHVALPAILRAIRGMTWIAVNWCQLTSGC